MGWSVSLARTLYSWFYHSKDYILNNFLLVCRSLLSVTCEALLLQVRSFASCVLSDVTQVLYTYFVRLQIFFILFSKIIEKSSIVIKTKINIIYMFRFSFKLHLFKAKLNGYFKGGACTVSRLRNGSSTQKITLSLPDILKFFLAKIYK